MKQNSHDNWFVDWFDSPYYHLLYRHRDDGEAFVFMKNLIAFLNLPTKAHIVDLACGKGRYSVLLNRLGFNVTGIDLSENNIRQAQTKYNQKYLHFKVQDMRNPLQLKADAVFNLFTSFGYFNSENEDIQVLQNIKAILNPKGIGVIDYLNSTRTQQTLIPQECKYIDGIAFDIRRSITKDGFIIKDIFFTDKGIKHHYTEKVKCLTFSDFESYFEQTGLQVKQVFGDYHLNPFNENNSQRCILIFSSL